MNCPNCQHPTTNYYAHTQRHNSSVEAYVKKYCAGCGYSCDHPAPTVRALPGPDDPYVKARVLREYDRTWRARFQESIEAPSKRCESPGCEGLHPNGLDSDPSLKGWVCLAKHEPSTATGEDLDQVGRGFQLRRHDGEPDRDFGTRLEAAHRDKLSKYLPPDADGLEWAREEVTGWWGVGQKYEMHEALQSICKMTVKEAGRLGSVRHLDYSVISKHRGANGLLTALDGMPVLRHAIREHLPRLRRDEDDALRKRILARMPVASGPQGAATENPAPKVGEAWESLIVCSDASAFHVVKRIGSDVDFDNGGMYDGASFAQMRDPAKWRKVQDAPAVAIGVDYAVWHKPKAVREGQTWSHSRFPNCKRCTISHGDESIRGVWYFDDNDHVFRGREMLTDDEWHFISEAPEQKTAATS